MNDRIEEAREALKLSAAYYRRLDNEIEKLLETPLSSPLRESILDTLHPLRGVDDKRRERRLTKRAALVDHLYTSPTIDNSTSKTVWGMIQAVTEIEQWEERRASREGHAERTLAYQLGVAPSGSAAGKIYRLLDNAGIGTMP